MLYYKVVNNKYLHKDKEWILMLHGIGGNLNIFKKQIDVLSENYNLLLVDLHGHGNSQNHTLKNMKKTKGEISFKYICEDIVEILDKLNIEKVNVLGISLGTIVGMQFEKYFPNRVYSMILGGGIVGMNLKSKFFLNLALVTKNIIPREIFYKIVAYMSMPCKNHKLSRNIFLKAAEKLDKNECFRWVELMREHLENYKYVKNNVKKIFIMGDQDHVFLPTIKKFVPEEDIVVIKNCGHICNIDSFKTFNHLTLNFLINNHGYMFGAKERRKYVYKYNFT
ncbi:alpha/beta fold hydrolase [Clostridium perfringens]|nr:alpha/beta fold hydrolase [Clostridium perfringens]EIF6158499.1 alpha/beta fold hydrolase [Clostridium perfringens]